MIDNKTVQSMFNEWFFHFRVPSLQQFSNLYLSTVSILEYFNKDNNDKKDRYSSKLKELENYFNNPMLELGKKYESSKIPKKSLDWDVAKIEWCYYRDTKFRTALGNEYTVDERKHQETRRVLLADIITILSLFKKELYLAMVQVLLDNDLNIFINIPMQVDPIKSGDIA